MDRGVGGDWRSTHWKSGELTGTKGRSLSRVRSIQWCYVDERITHIARLEIRSFGHAGWEVRECVHRIISQMPIGTGTGDKEPTPLRGDRRPWRKVCTPSSGGEAEDGGIHIVKSNVNNDRSKGWRGMQAGVILIK